MRIAVYVQHRRKINVHAGAAQFLPRQIGYGSGAVLVARSGQHHIGGQIVKAQRNGRIYRAAFIINGDKQRNLVRAFLGPALQFVYQLFGFFEGIVAPLNQHAANFAAFYDGAENFGAVHIGKDYQRLPQFFFQR